MEFVVEYDKEQDMLYYNLNTQAKSELRLYEDFHVEGTQLDGEQDMVDILEDLFWEFKGCIHGRDFYNSDWMEVGVKLGLVEKKVTTHTTTEYR